MAAAGREAGLAAVERVLAGGARAMPPPGRFAVEYLILAADDQVREHPPPQPPRSSPSPSRVSLASGAGAAGRGLGADGSAGWGGGGGGGAQVVARARGICLEQTVELPASLVPAGFIADEVVGRVEWLRPSGSSGRGPAGEHEWSVGISYADACAGEDLPQLLNVVFGNTSLQPGVKVQGLFLSPGILGLFRGPRFGPEGLRRLVGVAPGAPLVMTALKPMGLPTRALAEMAGKLAEGGVHIIKDDHGLANQEWSRFGERVEACAAAVREGCRAAGRSEGSSLYCPCLNAPAHLIRERAFYAKQKGAGAVMLLPGIGGFDIMRSLAEDPEFGLPIVCHPALLGGFTAARETHGMAPEVVLGTLPRLCGADSVIFPNHGGRFGFTPEECLGMARACREPLGHCRSAVPTPGGGMSLARIGGIVKEFGGDVCLLIGGSLLGHSPDLAEGARHFVRTTAEAGASLLEVPHRAAGRAATTAARTGSGARPAARGAEAPAPGPPPAKKARRRLGAPPEPPLDGPQSKVLRLARWDASGVSWAKVPLESYKPPADESWRGVSRVELVGKRGESCAQHLRYFEVAPGGYSTFERHQHEHVVVSLCGKGEVQLGSRIFQASPGEVTYTAPGVPHQFRCPEEARHPYGFLCIVNAQRDRPTLVDPAAYDPTVPGRPASSAPTQNTAKSSALRAGSDTGSGGGFWEWDGLTTTNFPDGLAHKHVRRVDLVGASGETTRFHMRYFGVGREGFTPFEKHTHSLTAMVVHGQGSVQAGCRVFALHRGDVVYLQPNEPHQFLGPDAGAASGSGLGLLVWVDARRGRAQPVDPATLFASSACH